MFKKANWHFGAGYLYFRSAGAAPIRVATLQGIDVDISASQKDLMGANQFAEASVRAGMKITGKVQTGRFDGRIISQLFLGASRAAGNVDTGLLIPVTDRAMQIPEGGMLELELGTATFDSDLGVIDAATGAAYVWVDKDPAVGEYSVDPHDGLYVFAEAEVGKRVLLSYVKADPSSGQTTTITNDVMGEGPTFEMVSFDGKGLFIQLYACQFNKLSLQRKNEDFLIPNLEFGAVADDARGIGRMSGA
ncbi:hypothetical protein [Paraburkholderia pallida]|uniref:Uncharacterized protein n=1 Tax=Paraburkholderia pallida TaxID=2547399 RepID=A0A4P7CVQ3_9BURK|nr:hypothetical protein [Paraburkholderia pallida]QBQ98171.1 hypothetical protein E1956_13965 [Paraburkholderia pallida]